MKLNLLIEKEKLPGENMSVILFLWILIIFWGIKIVKAGSPGLFSKEESIAVRGIAAFEIVLGHIGLETGSVILYPNRKAGILFVAIFFALSGYGLMYSKQVKTDYLKNFIPQKVKRLLIPAYAAYILLVLLLAIIKKYQISLYDFVNIKEIFMHTNWYVWEILLLYLVFWICFKISPRIAPYLILFFVVSFIFICFWTRVDNPWYGSTLSFVLGIYFFKYEKKIENFLVKYYPFLVGGILCALIVSIYLFFSIKEYDIWSNVIARNIASTSFIMFLILALHYVKIGNRCSVWLGEHSYQIYLFHFVFLSVFKGIIKNNFLYAILVITFTMIVAFLYRKIEKRLYDLKKYLEIFF